MRDNGLIQFLLHPLRTIWTITYGDRGDWAIEQGSMKLFLAVVLFPLNLLLQFIVFIFLSWTVSRNGRKFLLGSPALILVGLALTAVFIFNYFKDTVANRYRGEFHAKFAAEEYDTAQLWCDKVLSIVPDDVDYQYASATVVAETEKPEIALGPMKRLAPLEGEELGNIEAHVWCAKYYLGIDAEPDSSPGPDQDANLAIAKKHLLRSTEILQLESNQIQLDENEPRISHLFRETYYLLGQIAQIKWDGDDSMTFKGATDSMNSLKALVASPAQSMTGSNPALLAQQAAIVKRIEAIEKNDEILFEALGHYRTAASKFPFLFPRILNLVKIRFGVESAIFKRELKASTDLISLMSMDQARDYSNNYAIWKTLVDCYLVSGDYIKAEQQINRAGTMVTDVRVSQQLLRLRSNLFVHAVDNYDYVGKPEKRFQTRIRWLTRALQIFPQNPPAIAKMVELVEPPQGPLTEQQIDWLRGYAIDEEFSFVAHILQGMDSALRSLNSNDLNDKGNAILQWRLAVAQDKGSVEILTSVANYWSLKKETDLGSAVIGSELDNKGIDADPTKEKQEKDEKPKTNEPQFTQEQLDDPEFNYNDHLNEFQIANTHRAIRLMDLAVEMSPDEVKFLEMRGVLLYRVKRYSDAFDDLETAYDMNPQRAVSVQFLVFCAEKLGRKADLETYQERLDFMKSSMEKQRKMFEDRK